MVVDTPLDRAVFKDMVGETIYDMCHHFRIYWLDNALYFLYSKLLATSAQEARAGGNRSSAQVVLGLRCGCVCVCVCVCVRERELSLIHI